MWRPGHVAAIHSQDEAPGAVQRRRGGLAWQTSTGAWFSTKGRVSWEFCTTKRHASISTKHHASWPILSTKHLCFAGRSSELHRRQGRTFPSTGGRGASKYRVSASFRRLKQRRRETGEVAPRQQRYGRHPVLAPQLHTLAALIREQPDRTLADLQVALGTSASLADDLAGRETAGLYRKKKRCARPKIAPDLCFAGRFFRASRRVSHRPQSPLPLDRLPNVSQVVFR